MTVEGVAPGRWAIANTAARCERYFATVCGCIRARRVRARAMMSGLAISVQGGSAMSYVFSVASTRVFVRPRALSASAR
jgi:hypothetical protein